jgi:hypothetical protein
MGVWDAVARAGGISKSLYRMFRQIAQHFLAALSISSASAPTCIRASGLAMNPAFSLYI